MVRASRVGDGWDRTDEAGYPSWSSAHDHAHDDENPCLVDVALDDDGELHTEKPPGTMTADGCEVANDSGGGGGGDDDNVAANGGGSTPNQDTDAGAGDAGDAGGAGGSASGGLVGVLGLAQAVPKRRRTKLAGSDAGDEHEDLPVLPPAAVDDDDALLVTPPPTKVARLSLVIPDELAAAAGAEDQMQGGSGTRHGPYDDDDDDEAMAAAFEAPPRTPATVTRALTAAAGDLHHAVASADVDEVHRLLVNADTHAAGAAPSASEGQALRGGAAVLGGAARRLANTRSTAGFTPLSVAAALSDERRAATLCSLLLWHGSDVGVTNTNDTRTAMHWAAETGNVAALRAMLGREEGRDALHWRDDAGDTALHCASRWGRAECIAVLAEHGADPRLLTADTLEDAIAVSGQRRDEGFRNASAMRRARSASRRALYTSFPRLRLLVLHHADCQTHALSSSSDHQESPLRIPSILTKLARTLQPHEVLTMDAFAPASWACVARAHTPAYVKTLAALHRDVSPTSPLAFTPALRVARKRIDSTAAGGVASTPLAAAIARAKEESSDTYFTKGSLAAALRASGAAIEATRRVLLGEHKAAFVCVRPPGHHAGPDGPTDDGGSCGFCLLNHVAIAALDALAQGGVGTAAVGGVGGYGPAMGAMHPPQGVSAGAWQRPNALLRSAAGVGTTARDSPSDSWAVSSSVAQAATAAATAAMSLGGTVMPATTDPDATVMPPPPPPTHLRSVEDLRMTAGFPAAVPTNDAPVRRACRRVAILDFDIHHGNGTEAICRAWTKAQRLRGDVVAANALLFISVHLWHQPSPEEEFYPGSGLDDDLPCNIVNVPLEPLWKAAAEAEAAEKSEKEKKTEDADAAAIDVVEDKNGDTTARAVENDSGGGDEGGDGDDITESPSLPSGRAEFRKAIEDRVLPPLRAHGPDLIFLSSGFDGLLGDIGNSRLGLPGIDLRVSDFEFVTERVRSVATACDAPIVSILEGGYGAAGGRGGDLQRDGLASAASAHARALIL